jgi:hypothetical protein
MQPECLVRPFEDQDAMINIIEQGAERDGAAGMRCGARAIGPDDPSAEGRAEGEGGEPELEEVAREEHEYVRRRLREELKREPTEEEMDEWLRQQTEGH